MIELPFPPGEGMFYFDVNTELLILGAIRGDMTSMVHFGGDMSL